jgi:hypothetical protein
LATATKQRVVHLLVKVVTDGAAPIVPRVPMTQMLRDLAAVYDTIGVGVSFGPQESIEVLLPGGGAQVDFDVGRCRRGETTGDQNRLFRSRSNAQDSDVVMYLVRTTLPPFNGCAAHQVGRPGAIVVQDATRWTMAHELGHVLGLPHVTSNRNLMTDRGTVTLTGKPVLTTAQRTTIRKSPFCKGDG